MVEEKEGWFQRLKQGLQKSTTKISTGITQLLTHRKLDQETLDELEEILISSDLGVATSARLTASLSKQKFGQDITDDEVKSHFAAEISTILEPYAKPLVIDTNLKPHVVLVVGVNGAGKTTTIGKLAKQWKDQGLKVMMVAGDTFRAAAVEQLQIWGDRIAVPVQTTKPGGDAAGLTFNAIEDAQKNGIDVVVIDTAGRLQNKSELMDELKKIRRVIGKVDPSAPHSTLLILDATTGQNAVNQVEIFGQDIGITGLVMTKLDGTAKGGVVVAIADQFKLPIHAIGVGESVDDLHDFSATDFARNLMGVK